MDHVQMPDSFNSHENLGHKQKIQIGSSRTFGLVFFLVFLTISIWPLMGGQAIRLWALVIAISFLIASLFFKSVLNPLNVIWFKLGLYLHKIMNPIIMGLIFLSTIIPIGLLLRLTGKDPLYKNFDKSCTSYWIARKPNDKKSNTMKNQF